MRRPMTRLATLSALLGGAVLCALILMTCLSIIGRALSPFGLGPVPGDFEISEMGTAFVVFAFLPYAQLTGAHAVVDLLSIRLPAAAQRALLLLWDLAFAAVAVLILWRLWAGTADKLRYGETSYLLGIPLWWAYAAALAPAAAAALLAVWIAAARTAAAARGGDFDPAPPAARPEESGP